MKGTLFSADFITDSSDNLRLLEFNTDTGFYSNILNHFDYSEIHSIITSNNIVDFHVISKRFQEKFVNDLSQSLDVQGVITSFNSIVEEDYTLYPTMIEDVEGRFILRLAYDESAIFDSMYCKDNSEIYKLFIDASDSNSVAEVFVSSSDGSVYDTIVKQTNISSVPDVVVKNVLSGNTNVKFIKLQDEGTDEDKFNDFYAGLSDDTIVTKFYNSSESFQSSYRSYNVVYGQNLDVVNLANVKIPAIFEKPDSLTISEGYPSSDIDDKHFYEFSTNYPFFQPNDGYGGIFEEEYITDVDGNSVLVSSASIGTRYLSYFISGSPDSDLVTVFADWTFDGSSVPDGSYITSSILTNSVKSTLNKKLINNLIVSGAFSIRVTGNQHLLVYDSLENHLTYKEAYLIDEVTDKLLTLDGALVDIEANKIEVLEDNHHAYLLDMEAVDTFVLNESGINIKVVAHNACFPAGTKIKLTGGGEKNIEDIKSGDEVVSYDIAKREFTTARVEELKSSIQEDLIEITTYSGEVIKATLGHKMYTNKGWRDAKDLKKGDTLLNSLGQPTNIVTIQKHEGKFEVYHLMNVGTEHTYFANDILVHNYSRVGACFVDGTEVTLANNDLKNIEDIRPGDMVLTFNETTGEQEGKEIYEVLNPLHNDLVTYTLEDGTKVTSTYDHPYYVEGLGIKSFHPLKTNSLYNIGKEVEKIEVGDILLKEDGTKSVIVDIDASLKENNVRTTILRVVDNFNFYANGILVHNK